MNTRIEQLKNAVVDYLDTLIKQAAGGGRGKFRGSFTLFVEGQATPVLIVGTADGSVEDGSAIALLNPDQELFDRLRPGVAYSGGLLKEIVSGKCDGMVHVWLDAYVKTSTRAQLLDSYTPRKFAGAPKFEVS
ncbi:hypothetical protein LXA47_23610 [Massilia sp. P8910]|uniref:hypothetical protein n=1 Tax=Massilia antarctica TaxID=2765360 RepID=UPI001E299FA1|nr:hypothetical protein [Massilia antarctica]MCE3606567.1 hypothetical protein [Massilia antarctica]